MRNAYMKKISIIIFQMKIYIYNLKFDKHFFLRDVKIYDISKKYLINLLF